MVLRGEVTLVDCQGLVIENLRVIGNPVLTVDNSTVDFGDNSIPENVCLVLRNGGSINSANGSRQIAVSQSFGASFFIPSR
jgi:hypothetical protein